MLHKLIILSAGLFLMGCAGTALFDDSLVDRSLSPQTVIAEPETGQHKIVLWGGTILHIQNQQHSTQIEILAYPLNASYRPILDDKPVGRFIVRQQGFLEPADYAQGRLLTVLGRVSDIQTGLIGESVYKYPLVDAQQLQLWSEQTDKTRSRFSFGIGFRL